MRIPAIDSSLALRAEGLAKRYKIGRRYVESKPTLAGRALGLLAAPIRNYREVRRLSTVGESGDDVHWALRDVSFEVKHGETVGIIGRNGAGKSTLLKVLSRITAPSAGRAIVHGRVGSLLEVGTGFHPDLTGRENVYLHGAILGMDRAYVERRFEEIVDFAGVEKFIDTPVKRYSSGMYLRLAFAVAAHLEAEIMIVDEVLAVGDAQFQKKCLGKMSDASQEGRTVLFVSHNLTAVKSLCSRALLLRNGTLVADMPATEAVEQYMSEIRDSVTEQTWPDRASAPQNSSGIVRRIAMRTIDGMELEELTTATPFRVDVDFETKYANAYVTLQVTVNDLENNVIFSSYGNREPHFYGRPMPLGRFRASCLVPPHLLNSQSYTVDVTLYGQNFSEWQVIRDALRFEVEDSLEIRGDFFGEYPGGVRPDLPWTTAPLPDAAPAAR